MIFDKLSSERLTVLRFPLIVSVVLIHSAGTIVNSDAGGLGSDKSLYFFNFIQNILSDGLGRVAVPLFFLMSGFLFFLNVKWSFRQFNKKIKSRIYTLLIPFLFWNLFVMTIFFIAQETPLTSVFFSGSNQNISTYSLFDFFNNLLGLTKLPIAYQFWFIRDLIIMVSLTPLLILFFQNKFLAKLLLIILTSIWFFDFWPYGVPSIAAIFFFYLGCYISNFEIDLFSMDDYGRNISIIYLLILFVDCFTKGESFNVLLHHLGIILGVAAVLYWSKLVCNQPLAKSFLLRLSMYSFFIFALHEPLLIIFKKLLYKIISPESEFTLVLIYVFIPLVITFVSILSYKLLNKIIPESLSFVVGGR